MAAFALLSASASQTSEQGNGAETFSTDSQNQSKNEVFTVVYTTSDDGFLNVRSKPSNSGTILAKVYSIMHGLGNGVLVQRGPKWSKVRVGKTTGWVYNKFMGCQTWYTGKGKATLIAKRDRTPIYGEDYTGEKPLPVFATVKKGTIIADEYKEDGEYYLLVTAHDNLSIKKSDVEVVR